MNGAAVLQQTTAIEFQQAPWPARTTIKRTFRALERWIEDREVNVCAENRCRRMSVATDEECRVVIDTWASLHDRIVGYSTPHDSPNGLNRTWGAPHYIRDDRLPADKQELWRGNGREEMLDRVEVERMRVAIDKLFELRAAR